MHKHEHARDTAVFTLFSSRATLATYKPFICLLTAFIADDYRRTENRTHVVSAIQGRTPTRTHFINANA